MFSSGVSPYPAMPGQQVRVPCLTPLCHQTSEPEDTSQGNRDGGGPRARPRLGRITRVGSG